MTDRTLRYAKSVNQLDPCYTNWKRYLIHSYKSHLNLHNPQQNPNFQISNHLLNDANDELFILPMSDGADIPRTPSVDHLLVPIFTSSSVIGSGTTSSGHRIGDHLLASRKEIRNAQSRRLSQETDEPAKTKSSNGAFHRFIMIILCRGS